MLPAGQPTGNIRKPGQGAGERDARADGVAAGTIGELGESYGKEPEELGEAATKAEEAWRAAERVAFTEEQIARSELVRQLHSNRGALRVLYPSVRRVASYFPPSHSRAAGEPETETENGGRRRERRGTNASVGQTRRKTLRKLQTPQTSTSIRAATSEHAKTS
jgi:hypothetical protein